MSALAVLAVVGGLWLIWAGITGASIVDTVREAFAA